MTPGIRVNTGSTKRRPPTERAAPAGGRPDSSPSAPSGTVNAISREIINDKNFTATEEMR